MKHLRTVSCLLGLMIIGGSTTSQAAYTVLYSDTTTFTQGAYAGGGATSVGGSVTTTMVADDIRAGVDILFYNANPSTGAPTTLIAGFALNPITFTAGSLQLVTASSASPLFTMPTGLYWAGIVFNDSGGTTGATAAQLNNLGQGTFNPPTVGSSQDAFFQATSASSLGSSNPAGSFLYFGGNPTANFGWEFDGTAPTVTAPEPSSLAMAGMALGILGVGSRLVRGRRKAPEVKAA